VEFPHLQEIYDKFRTKGLNVIGVNYGDPLDAIQEFRKEFKLTMPLLQGGKGDTSVSKTYGVRAYPTNYVLDKDGKVYAQFVGYDEKALLKALADLGIKE
jgi:peroxiredoxin